MQKRFTQRTLALLGAATALSVGVLSGAGSAHAAEPRQDRQAVTQARLQLSPTETIWEVPMGTVYGNDPWPFAGKCKGTSHAVYDTAANSLRVVSRAENISAMAGCRLQARLTLHLSMFGYARQDVVVDAIPTACSDDRLLAPGGSQCGAAGTWHGLE